MFDLLIRMFLHLSQKETWHEILTLLKSKGILPLTSVGR